MLSPAMDGSFIPSHVPFYGWLLKHGLASAATLKTTMQKLKDGSARYDVIHVHSNLNALLLSRLSGVVPLLYTMHDPPPSTVHYERFDERFVREAVFRCIDVPAVRRVNHVITVNPAIRESLSAYGVEREKISVISNGTDLRPHSRKSRDANLGIFVGQLVNRKGAHIILQALSRLPNIRVEIVGDGPERTRLVELSKRLHCSNRVVFHSYLPREDLEECYARASFGIFPTLADAMPTLALLECMAHGVPPLVSRVPGSTWVIRSGENGLLFQPGSVSELGELLSLVESDQNFCRKMGENARHLVEQNFSWDAVARKVVSVYEKAALYSQPRC